MNWSVNQLDSRSVIVNEFVNRFVNLSARQLDSSIHQCFCSTICDSQQTISPIGFLFLKLPPPPRAVLLAISGEVERACPKNQQTLLCVCVGFVALVLAAS